MVFFQDPYSQNSNRDVVRAAAMSSEKSRMHPDDHAAHMQWILVNRLWERMNNPVQDPNSFIPRIG